MTGSQDNPIFAENLAHPRHRGKLAAPDGIGRAGGEACPDTITIQITVRDDTIADIAFDSTGCDTAIACGSVTCELALGKHLDDAAEITGETVCSALGGLPADKRHVARLAGEALSNAVWDYIVQGIERGNAKG